MQIKKTEIKKILVCRTDALGDTLLTLPVCTALKRALPGVHIAMLVSAYTRDIVEQHPDVDRVLVYAPDSARALVRDLRSQKFDAALLVFPDRKVSWAMFRSRIPVRVGTGRRWWSFLYNLKVRHSRAKAEKHEAEYNLDLVRALGLEAVLELPQVRVRPEARAWAENYCLQLGVKRGDSLVIIHPGGRGSSANWGAASYGRLADILMQAKRCKILLTGSMAEQDQLAEVAKQCQQAPFRLEQAITLPQLAALLACAKVVVAGNTGPLHLACAVGAAVVTVFPALGVSGPKRWGPLGTKTSVLTPSDLSQPDDLETILPEAVAVQVTDWLKKTSKGNH